MMGPENRRMWKALGAGVAFILGTASAPTDAAPTVPPVQPTLDQEHAATSDLSQCTLPPGWASVEKHKPDFVIFGEIHGTQQSPAFVGRVACSLAKSGRKVLIGVEFDAGVDPRFQAAWALPHSKFVDAFGRAGWAGRQDGVASEAMFDLLVRLHALKAAGARIGIVAFNGARNNDQRNRLAELPGQGPHEAAQAENISRAFQASKYDVALILVGGIHAQKRLVELEDIQFEPMAMRLAASGTIVSLKMKSAGGNAWNCTLKGSYSPEPGKPILNSALDCANHPVRPDADLPSGAFVSLAPLLNGKNDDRYDGFFWIGKVSGSAPAVSGYR